MERRPPDEAELSAPEEDDLAEPPEDPAGRELRVAIAKLLRALADRIERG